jgi:DNA polymerase-1
MLIKLLAEERPDLIAVFFDSGAPTVRLAKDAEYKGGPGRDTWRLPAAAGVDRGSAGGAEDPGAAHRRRQRGRRRHRHPGQRAAEQGIDATIVTADRDFFQLVSPLITVMFNRKGISDIVRYDEAAVTERFGITPSQYLDFVALKGDTSDNIPGVPGVGDKTAAKLINSSAPWRNSCANTDQLKGKQRRTSRRARSACRSTRSSPRSSPTFRCP